ncbi:DUF6602 domain-containing protein [Microbulbifer sp. JMSA002]|uniref:DUF6602 domain-containing protein n=1 Tax=Microbulbifer sp. JMSA002 TaxID=3243368 RepID=UPI004039AB0F
MKEKLKIEFPAQGWKQFLTSRKEMLDAFDRAREKSRIHEVETYHGRVAEAEFRKWLSSFLPKRYGVTAGYIVSPGLKSNQKTPHFDVIIYDQLESPVLWVEDSPDSSDHGKSLAIPVEYVRCVLEVKSKLTSTTAQDAVEHLKDLLPLMGGPDDPDQKYKLYLPPTFCCGLAFFELQEKNQFSNAALEKLIAGKELRGFFGGLVLRGEGHDKDVTGKLSLLRARESIDSTIGKGKSSLLKVGIAKSVKASDNLHFSAMVMWSESHFSQFGFDILAMMQGTYEVGRLSSFHGMGAS